MSESLSYALYRTSGDTVILSGIIARSEDLHLDFAGQVTSVFDVVRERLSGAGLTLEDVINVTCYLSEKDHFPQYEQAWQSVFAHTPPARTTVASTLLVDGALLEVCVTASQLKG